jgi:hypothetical protein
MYQFPVVGGSFEFYNQAVYHKLKRFSSISQAGLGLSHTTQLKMDEMLT